MTSTKRWRWVGKRVRIAPADHEHSRESGLVIAQEPCNHCPPGAESCGYDDLIVQLCGGIETRVYELEVDVID